MSNHGDACTATQPSIRRLKLEIGGTKNTSVPSTLDKDAIVIDVKKLPNPYTLISKNLLASSAPDIIDWMSMKSPKTEEYLQEFVSRAQAAFSENRSVRVECYGGAHRSQAVAWKILTAAKSDVQVMCLDCVPLPELLAFICE